MAAPGPWGNRARSLFPRLLLGLSAKMNLDRHRLANQLLNSCLKFQSNHGNAVPAPNQLPFSTALIRLANSSNEVSPLIFSPLMKKVGVESTFRTSLAYFWSAAILSSSAWSFRQASTCCALRPACLPIRVSVSVVFLVTQSFC